MPNLGAVIEYVEHSRGPHWAKALGTGIHSGVGWRDIEVERAANGRPSLLLHGRAAAIAQQMGVRHAAISLTHTRSHALAQVLLED